MSSPRAKKIAPPMKDTDFPSFIAEPQEVAAPRWPVPVVAAANLMVMRTFEAHPEICESIRQGGAAVIVEVPSAEWVNPVADAWNRILTGQALYSEPPPEKDEEERSLWNSTARQWREIRANGEKPDRLDVGKIAFALSSGYSVLGFSQTPERHLPQDLLRVADLHIVIPPLDVDGLMHVAEEISGTSATLRFPEALCRLISVNDLRLARRPSQTADTYLAKLLTLVEGKYVKGNLTLDNLHGMDEAVTWGRSVSVDLKEYSDGRLPWSEVDKGACLYGPPGTGKTTFAKALAASCGVPLISGSLHQWQAAGHLGDLLKLMRGTFESARKTAPCILFVDEIDSFGNRLSFTHEHRDYSIQVVNGFLEEIDGVGGREGVVLLGACNYPERLDPAIVRSGRLDRMIPIRLPDRQSLAEIFRYHVGPELSAADLAKAANMALGGTGADVERWSRGAKRRARTARRPISIDDLLAEMRNVTDRKPETAWTCAVHESGHAILVTLLAPGTIVSATIRETAMTGGGVTTKPSDGISNRDAMMARIIVLLGGRAAEEVIIGERSASSGGNERSDLAQATALAASMLTAYGFDDGPSLGLLWLGEVNPNNVDVALRLRPGMEGKVAAILTDAYAKSLELLQANSAALKAVAQALMEHETLCGADIEEMMELNRPSSSETNPDEIWAKRL